MKRILLCILIPLIGAAVYWGFTNCAGKKESYGTLVLSSEIEGLPVYIDETQVGLTTKEPQAFNLPPYGSYGHWDHEVVVQQEISATQEYFFSERFSFNQYIDVEENPITRISLFSSPPQNDTYPPENFTISARLKPDLLARQTGLIQSTKLKHNYAWHMAQDNSHIYVLSRADTDLYRKSENEKVEGEFLEVYNKETLAFIAQKQLSYKNDTFATYSAIAVSEDTIYIGDRNARLLMLDKHSLEVMEIKEYPAGFDREITGLMAYQDYLVVYGEGSRMVVFQKDKPLYLIDEEQDYPANIQEIRDYNDYNRINTVLLHKGVLYATNFRGFINAYALEDGRFLRQINTIKFEKEWDYVVGSSIEASGCYLDRYLYFSIDYDGLLIVDTQTGETSRIETLFHKDIVYDELFKEELDMTKKTDIYKMVFYRHFLIFTEVNALKNFVYAYDLESGQIVHAFKGHRDAITALFLDGDRLTGPSTAGLLYRWDLRVLEKSKTAAVLGR